MNEKFINIKMDKRFFSVVSLSDPSGDRGYWLGRQPMERMRHIEVLRRINYGHRSAAGLQRVLEYTEG